MRLTLLSSAATAVALLAIPSAYAGVVTFTMQNGDGGGGPFNTTAFTVTNISSPGVQLTEMSFTVGDTQYLFDQLYLNAELFGGGDGTQLATLLVGDRDDDNAGPDFFSYGFSNFGAGMSFSGQWDIDNDNGDFNADTRNVFFNNGLAPNAVATFQFSDGSFVSFEFPDLPIADRYTLTIPAPGAAAVFAGLAGFARRRRR